METALCSYGLSGRVFHAPFIDLHPGFKLVGSWERSKKLIQEHYSEVKSYPSLEALLANEQVNFVSQFSDIKPSDWAFQALRSLVERYGY